MTERPDLSREPGGTTPTERLDALGAAPTPAPDPLFVERLESHLRLSHAHTAPAPRRRLVPALAVSLVLVAFALAAVRISRVESASARLDVAHGVTVVTPDGSVLVDPPPGTELGDGALVLVDETGWAVVDGVELGPGSAVRIDRDALVTPFDPTPVTDTGQTAAAPEPGADGAPEPSDSPEPAAPAGSDPAPPTSVPGDTPAAPSPPPAAPPAPPVPTDAPPAPSTPPAPPPRDRPVPAPTDRPGPPPPEPPVPGRPHPAAPGLALRLRPTDAGVEVRFQLAGHVGPDVTLVLVRTAGSGPATPEPSWPLDGATVEVARRRGGEAIRLVDPWPPDATLVRYRVVALAGDAELGRSAVQSVAR